MTTAKQQPPCAFDFAALQREIVAASKIAFRDMAQRSPDDPVCSFALYSDDDAMTVCPAFDTVAKQAARLAADPHLSNKYCPPEWAYEMVGAEREFSAISKELSDYVRSVGDGHAAFREEVFETCLRALDELRTSGEFSPTLLIMFDVSDTDFPTETMKAWVRRLNPGSAHVTEHERWSLTWAGS